MKKVITILSLVCISLTVFAGQQVQTKKITGVNALALYSSIGGPDVSVPGVIGLAEAGRIECATEQVGSQAYHFCSVDQGKEDLGQVFGENGINLSAALLGAKVPLKVNSVKCERQISEIQNNVDLSYEKVESTECIIKY